MNTQARIAKVLLPNGPVGKVLQDIASPASWNCEFNGGSLIELPNGLKFRVWAFTPPAQVYAEFELEELAERAFIMWARRNNKELPEKAQFWSVGVEDEGFLIIETFANKK